MGLRHGAVVREQERRHRRQEQRQPGGRLVVEPAREDVEPEREEERPGDRVQAHEQDGGAEDVERRHHVDAVQRAHEGLPVEEDRPVLPAQEVLRDEGHRRVVAGNALVVHRGDAQEAGERQQSHDDEPARPARGAARRDSV